MQRGHLKRQSSAIASRSIFAGLLIFLITGVASGQANNLASIRKAFNNGQFEEVVRIAPERIRTARETKMPSVATEMGMFQAHAFMRLERYEDAAKSLDEALMYATRAKHSRNTAIVYLAKASLARLQRDFHSAILFARDALATSPGDSQTKLEYNLAIGRIMYSSGYDIAAIVWLERAEKVSANLPMSSARLDALGHLSFAWASKFNYAKAIEYGEKLVALSEKTEFGYRHRLALYDLANLLNSIGQKRRAETLYDKGLKLSLAAKDGNQSSLFLSTQMLDSLYEGDIEGGERHLQRLVHVDSNKRFQSLSLLGKAVIAGLKGQKHVSDSYFKEASSLKAHSEFIVPHWKSILAERRKDWAASIEQIEVLRKPTEEANFRDDLPDIYFNLAKAYWGLGKRELAFDYARRSAAIVESDRPKSEAPLSLSILETYHSVYRLLAEIEENGNNVTGALALADFSKARVLRDRIENSTLRRKPDVSVELRKRADELSTKWVEGSDVRELLGELERLVTLSSSNGNEGLKTESDAFEKFEVPPGKAIVSYFFTFDGALRAFVLEKGKRVRIVKLSLPEREADNLAKTIRTQVRDHIFFKSNGKSIYDKLLAPLSIDSEHIVIVPDKSLWKIPFQALSADGESYLIEQRMISYAPSVSLLMNELKMPPPIRKSIQVFANDSFQDRYLAYVNREAQNVAGIFSSRPLINTTRRQFLRLAGESDIVHFSMHAQADQEEPLNSFLAFRSQGPDPGRITVEDLLGVQMKRQSLAFLASCETSNVLKGEGVVSIAWALLGSGSSAVVSAQWEANDRSALQFTEEFYKQYREGKTAAKALQAASVAMIRNKARESHEPYLWAAFSLMGDYR